MRWFKYLIYFLVAVYLAFCGALYFGQEKLLFYPHPLPEDFRPPNAQEVWIPVDDDIRLHAAHVKSPASKGVILYLHGNKGNVHRCLYQTRSFRNQGYDIFIPDYRSYGKSEGKLINEAQMYADVQACYDFLHQSYEDIVVIGYSMGTGMASYLAANNQVSSLIMVAPYVSLVDMKNRYLPFTPDFLLKYPFRSDLHLAKVTCPITLIHGQQDQVIPVDSSVRLHDLHPDSKLLSIPNLDHRGAIFHTAIGQAVQASSSIF